MTAIARKDLDVAESLLFDYILAESERARAIWERAIKAANESKPPNLAQKTLNEVAWRPLKRRRK